MIYASSGYQVSLYDVDPEQVTRAKADIAEQLVVLEEQKLLISTQGPP